VYVTGRVPVLFEQVGRLIVDWMIHKTGGNVNVFIVQSKELFATSAYIDAMEDEFNTRCPECKRSYVNVPVVDWSSKITAPCQSAILRDPDLNYIVPIYDSMSQFVVPAITITNARDRVKIATFNGTPFVLKMVQDGQVEMDIGENLDWIGRANMDTYMRALCILDLPSPTPNRPASPIYIFDASNAHTAGTPPQMSVGYGTEYIEGYRKLWGLQ
jgi:ribose transport system substrate-binding protein